MLRDNENHFHLQIFTDCLPSSPKNELLNSLLNTFFYECDKNLFRFISVFIFTTTSHDTLIIDGRRMNMRQKSDNFHLIESTNRIHNKCFCAHYIRRQF